MLTNSVDINNQITSPYADMSYLLTYAQYDLTDNNKFVKCSTKDLTCTFDTGT